MLSDERLAAWHAEGAAAWPSLHLPLAQLRAHLERSGADDADELHAVDLYLACACAAGDAAAVRALDATLLAEVPRFVARVDASPTFGADVQQAVRTHLLVGSGGNPAITTYAGRGALKSWLQVMALRLALRLRQRQPDDVDLADVEHILGTPDPELQFVKKLAREDFRLAFATALAELEPAERLLLKLHYLEGLSLAQIGATEQVDKSTISRRLQSIRETLLQKTREQLRTTLALDDGDLDSMMGLIASQLDLSIEAFLRSR